MQLALKNISVLSVLLYCMFYQCVKFWFVIKTHKFAMLFTKMYEEYIQLYGVFNPLGTS